tara:strand:+ start:5840 stop:6241 length:402 start_codon:yes stop_codon:yes gene_type:complete
VSKLNIKLPPPAAGFLGSNPEELASQVPDPVGYRILCMCPEIEQKTTGGILKPDDYMRKEEILSTVLFVMKMGSDCYRDQARFPDGPWCKEGDFVLVRPNAGTRIKIHGKEFRVINDDAIEAVVADPRGIERA